MKQIYLHIFVATALTLEACSNDDIEPNAVRDFPTFSASIDGSHSRATDNYWEDGDKIGISGGGTINVCYLYNVTQDGDTLVLVNPEQQFYFKDTNDVKFTAYYPYTPDMPESKALDASTANQANQKEFDFLWASATGSRISPSVNFTCTHQMTKVTFVFQNGRNTDVSAINKIRLNDLAMEGTFDTTTGSCEVSEETTAAPVTVDLTDVRADEPVTALILFPQKAESVKLEIYDSGSQYYVCNLSIPDNELKAGINYTYTITVNKTGLQVTGATLSDWIEEGGESGASSADD